MCWSICSLYARNDFQDRSWRVRGVVAEKYTEFQAGFTEDVIKSDLIGLLVKLFHDAEPEVNTC